MTQLEETNIPDSAVAVNDPGYWDVWHNPTEQEFIVAVHIDHNMPRGGKRKAVNPMTGRLAPGDEPRKEYFRLLPHTDTPIPRHHRSAVQVYQCDHPDCRASSGSKLCLKDHPAVVSGGQCPLAIRKGAPHIRPNAVFSPDLVERVLPSDGTTHGKRTTDNRSEIQPKLEALWKRITSEPVDVAFGPTGPQPKPRRQGAPAKE